ncbi:MULTISPECIES: hypothetical protein [Streptomyces]|uniref:Uncharacterized protein n=1 Tax=Streptomyces spororaveus TaxID=284039 RepID=A0ABQ3T8U8_9ACTN|nr:MULTISPECIES: hypothetical protein [Streptomyces]MCM9082746.1 hypothetical protein [Streptomyces spororaveus]MCX5302485.1 hypothetical protein [Streptomyces sp. NBC_00160]GHI76827.1 hypothetical protein Sspor_23880 [Streptomyces spororaveus]
MSRAFRCLLLLAVLLAGGAQVAAEAGAGPGEGSGSHGIAQDARRARDGATVVLAADPLDTSWGDGYIRPLH